MLVHMCKSVDQKAAVLAIKRSASVAQEVNAGNPLQVCEKAHKLGIHPYLKLMEDDTRSPQQEYQWLHKKNLCFPKKLIKYRK